MKWKKLGNIFNPDDFRTKQGDSHASNPTALVLNERVVRIFYSSRSIENKSNIFYVDIDFEDNFKVVSHSETPVICHGSPGYFDDCGVSCGSVISIDGEIFLYYVGWNLCKTVPWRNSIGLAISEDQGKTFTKFQASPVLDRNKHDPFSLSYPFVLKVHDKYKMWYGSNLTWGESISSMTHTIKTANSSNAIDWNPLGINTLELDLNKEVAISRPSIIVEDNLYKMYYSYRNANYKIGYATSTDGETFCRQDESIIFKSDTNENWDSEQMCYPHVFKLKNKTYMLYNGNGYGKTGFGLAMKLKGV